jgi:membrane-associated protease RseP (regulator of RpoE activity)
VVKASARSLSKDERIFLEEGGTATVSLELEGHGRIVGTVGGKHGAFAHVVAYRHYLERELSRSTNAASDGTYVLEVPAGEYRVGAFARGTFVQRFDQSIHVSVGQDTRVDLELKADAGEGWGPMASVARGEVGGSFENESGSVKVSWVIADSPLSSAGLRVGDLVTAIDGRPVTDALDAFARTRGAPGASVDITYRRDGSEHTVSVALAQ